MTRNVFAGAVVAVLGLGCGAASAQSVYITSLDANGQFGVYDVASGSWSTLGGYRTFSNFAVDSDGTMYGVSADTGAIQRYDPANDAWNDVMAGPGAVLNKGNLEITRAGEFLYSGGNQSLLYYTSGGAWSSIDLGFNGNALGDYDPATNVLVLGEFGRPNLHVLDVATLTITGTFTESTGNGEWARGLDIHSASGTGYYQWANIPVSAFDVGSLAGPNPIGGGFAFYDSLAVDQGTGLVYVASLNGADFQVIDLATGVVTGLAGFGNLGNHSSLAWVGSANGCAADLDGDGDADVNDFFLYLDLFEAGDPRADITGDGSVDVNDFFAYLDLFEQGC